MNMLIRDVRLFLHVAFLIFCHNYGRIVINMYSCLEPP